MWNERWIPYKEGVRKPRSNVWAQFTCVNDLWDIEGWWDEININSCFDDIQDREQITKIYISQNKGEDMRVRPSTKKLPIDNQVGKKKKKSDQIGLQNSFYQDKKNANNNNTFVWWTKFWKIPLPLSILIFGWKCLKRAILVEVSLYPS